MFTAKQRPARALPAGAPYSGWLYESRVTTWGQVSACFQYIVLSYVLFRAAEKWWIHWLFVKKSLLVKKNPAHPNNEEEDSAKQWEQKLLKSTRIRIPINYYQFSLNVHQLLSILINYDHFSLIMINFHQLLSIFINYDHFSLIMINFHQLWSIFINYDQGLRLGQIVSVQDPDLDSGEASGETQWTGNW